MTGLPRARLDDPAGAECRRLCREHLDRAAAACRRLADPDDAEALHDFRVALRRLRGTLRAFPAPLAGAAGKKWNRRLADLASATGGGRDAEVALAWVEAQRPHLNWRQRRGLDGYAERLAGRKERAYAEVLAAVPGRFAKLAARLARRLEELTEPTKSGPAAEEDGAAAGLETGPGGPVSVPPAAEAGAGAEMKSAASEPTTAGDGAGDLRSQVSHDVEPGPSATPTDSAAELGLSAPGPGGPPAGDPFALVLAAAARDASSRLVERLGRIGGAGDERAAHRARIAAKRLRYILEPAVGAAAEAKAAVRGLKGLQDLLGELHDAHVLERALAEETQRAARRRARELLAAAVAGTEEEAPEVVTAAAGRWDGVGGLVALAARNRERRDRLFTRLARGWLAGPRTADLAAAVGGLAARLEAAAAVAGAAAALEIAAEDGSA